MFKKVLLLPKKFKIFVSNLQIENQAAITRRYRKIIEKLNADYWHIKSDSRNAHFIGSYGRGTAIKGNRNINVMMVLPPALYESVDNDDGNGEIALLRDLRYRIAEIFKDTVIKEDENGEVIVPWSDACEFEIIPAFSNKRGNYYYPSIHNGGTWNEFNPIREIDVIDELNFKYGGKIKHLAQIMRAWKYTNNVPIEGMLLDTLVMDFIENWEGKDKSYQYYGVMTLNFYEYLAGRSDAKEHWYARGSNRELPRTGFFGDHANQAYKLTLEALQHEQERDQRQADKYWKKIYGEYFKV